MRGSRVPAGLVALLRSLSPRSSGERATASGAVSAGSNPVGGTRSNMQPDMLIVALPTDLHLHARPSASCSIPPLVPMSWPPMQLIARPRSKLRPEGRSCVQHRSRTLASSTHSQARSNRPRTPSTGGMSYGKLPSGACGLIRSLRVSRLANRHDTESDISPTRRGWEMRRWRRWPYADHPILGVLVLPPPSGLSNAAMATR